MRSKLRFWSSANSQTFIFSFKPLLTWKIPVLETPLPRPVVNSASVGSSPSWVRPREGRCTVSAAQPGPSCPISGGCSGKSVFPQRSGPLCGGTVIRSLCRFPQILSASLEACVPLLRPAVGSGILGGCHLLSFVHLEAWALPLWTPEQSQEDERLGAEGLGPHGLTQISELVPEDTGLSHSACRRGAAALGVGRAEAHPCWLGPFCRGRCSQESCSRHWSRHQAPTPTPGLPCLGCGELLRRQVEKRPPRQAPRAPPLGEGAEGNQPEGRGGSCSAPRPSGSILDSKPKNASFPNCVFIYL